MANPAELSIEELIDRYSIRYKQAYIPGEGIIVSKEFQPMKVDLAREENAYAVVNVKSAEIAAKLAEYAAAAEAKAVARQAAIDAIPGLDKLLATTDAHEYDELAIEYPKAACFITADNWANSNHPVKVIAGTTARERIIEGEVPNVCIEEMHSAFMAHLDSLNK